MAYATGRCMCNGLLRHPFSVEHVTQMVRHVYGERVTFYSGNGEVAPGVTVHRVGGHSDGLQVVKVETARMVVYKAAWLSDQGQASGKDLAIAKYYATEIGSECANLAIQVHGGWGFMDDCPASRYLRDNRVCTIGDGSSQIQTLLIARELGLDVSFA